MWIWHLSFSKARKNHVENLWSPWQWDNVNVHVRAWNCHIVRSSVHKVKFMTQKRRLLWMILYQNMKKKIHITNFVSSNCILNSSFQNFPLFRVTHHASMITDKCIDILQILIWITIHPGTWWPRYSLRLMQSSFWSTKNLRSWFNYTTVHHLCIASPRPCRG